MNRNKSCFSQVDLSFTKTKPEINAHHEFDFEYTIVPKSAPRIIRKCVRCTADRFASSDRFRINANKKILDVWLVFKCISCDYTLNVSILSRVAVTSIDRDLLNRFHENDTELAWQYAFDPAYIEKGMVVDWDIEFDLETQINVETQHLVSPQNKFLGEGVSCAQEIKRGFNKESEAQTFLIRSRFFLKIPIYAILRKILDVSRSRLDKMQTNGNIEMTTFQGKSLTLKNSIGFGCSVRLMSNLEPPS